LKRKAGLRLRLFHGSCVGIRQSYVVAETSWYLGKLEADIANTLKKTAYIMSVFIFWRKI